LCRRRLRAASSSIGSTWSTRSGFQSGITNPAQPWIANAPGAPPAIAAEVVAVIRERIRIVELVGRVMTRLRRQLCGAFDHVADVLRRHVRPSLFRPWLAP
jgi:hypothetical protein